MSCIDNVYVYIMGENLTSCYLFSLKLAFFSIQWPTWDYPYTVSFLYLL